MGRKTLVIDGWEAGIRTPISRVRVCCPTVERPPSKRENYIDLLILLSSFWVVRFSPEGTAENSPPIYRWEEGE